MDIWHQEKELAHLAGVRHPANEPFLLQPDTPNGVGVLLVHGFTASPYELRELGEVLCQRGFTVFAVRLPGHGTSPEDLAERCYTEWLAAVDRGYRLLAALNLRICGAGLSTGALLLLELALRRQVTALVLLSPYLQLRHPLAPFTALLSRIIPYQVRDIPVAEQAFYYHRRPLRGIAEINRLRRRLAPRLKEIDAPALVLAADGDQTIAPETAQRLYQRLGSRIKEFHSYGAEVPHVLTTDENPHKADVFARTVNFLRRFGGLERPFD